VRRGRRMRRRMRERIVPERRALHERYVLLRSDVVQRMLLGRCVRGLRRGRKLPRLCAAHGGRSLRVLLSGTNGVSGEWVLRRGVVQPDVEPMRPQPRL
jgi:hypothetical protein